MTSYEFEVAAKNAVIQELEKMDTLVTIRDLHMVWFAHVLGQKKCLIFCSDAPLMYFEVTFNTGKCEMYVDTYIKHSNTVVSADEINTTVDA